MPSVPAISPRQIWPVLVVSGGLGALCGGWLQPTWQDVIEPAQVLAGVVLYDNFDPVYLYSTRTWTLLHQLTALCLAIGIPEWCMTVAWSATVGALSFQAVALTAHVMGAPARVAALCAVPIWVTGMTLLATHYESPLLGWRGTYGQVGHPFLLMTVALLAARRDRAAAFALGLFPGIHVTMGGWSWLLLAVVLAADPPVWRGRMRAAAPWFGLGLAVTLTSAVVHVGWFVGPPPEVTAEAEAVLRQVRTEDGHRFPIVWGGVRYMALLALPPILLLLQRRSPSIPRHSRIIAVAFVAAMAIWLATDLLVRVMPELVGTWISRPMPGRLMSLASIGMGAWLIGLATSPATAATARLSGTAVFVLVTGWALVAAIGPDAFGEPDWRIRAPFEISPPRMAIALLTMSLTALWLGSVCPVRWQAHAATLAKRAVFALTVLLSILAVVIAGRALLEGPENVRATITDDIDHVLKRASHRPGKLLTSLDMHLIQARTRRPVLLDYQANNFLIYVPEAADAAEKVLHHVYGQSLLAPGPLREDDSEPDDVVAALWQRRLLPEWQALRAEFGVTDILTPPDWQLLLPRVTASPDFALWTIPERVGTAFR
jgi:hypothetical protein